MENFFQDMRALYDTRDIKGIDAFLEKWISPDCFIMGTALGELMLSREEVRKLFHDDLRYWYDLALDADNATCESFGDMTLISSKAELSYTINDNAKRNEGYASWCESIADDNEASPSVKAAQLAFILDTLLSSRKYKRRKNRFPLTVRALMRDGKAEFISFAFDKTKDTADHYAGDGEDTAKSLSEERTLVGGNAPEYISAYISGKGYTDITAGVRGDVFFGVALEERRETLDEASALALEEYKAQKDVDTYRRLYDLRLHIAFLQKIYAIEPHPHAVVRFFGLAREGKVELFVPTYPLGMYIEWQ